MSQSTDAPTLKKAATAPVIKRDRREGWSRRLPLMPAMIFLIALTQLPFVVTIAVSFMNWNANFPDEIGWKGFGNYVLVFQNDDLRSAILDSVLFTVTVVIVSLLLGLGIAILLNQRFRGRAVVRTLMITPFLLVPVAAALIWKHLMFNPSYGFINGVIAWFCHLVGIHDIPQPSWVQDWPMTTISATLIWQWTPFMMLILLAGLQSQPPEVIEAARVDGAGAWQIFRSMTLPHLRRYLELSTLLGAIFVFQNFDSVFTLTAGAFNTANLPFTIYQTFFQSQDYGLASAMGVVTVIGTIIVVTFFLRGLTSLTPEGHR